MVALVTLAVSVVFPPGATGDGATLAEVVYWAPGTEVAVGVRVGVAVPGVSVLGNVGVLVGAGLEPSSATG